MMSKPQVLVIGAGAFGSWIALFLLRRGARVQLVDAWGPGNSRSSSGGETRIIRGGYGPDQPYTRMTARALDLWREHEQRCQRQLLHRTGVLWMAGEDDSYERGSLPELRRAGLPFQQLHPDQMQSRWPQINFQGVKWGIYELEAGYLSARLACQTTVQRFVTEGGSYAQAVVSTEGIESGHGQQAVLCDGNNLKADFYIFACGSWMGKLFPQAIGNRIRVTKQDVFFFGTPLGSDRFDEGHLPVWADHGKRFFYGIPGNGGRGLKIADDTRGPDFDPTAGERVVSAQALRRVRQYLSFRFPALKDAPLLETRVCQYENTPDQHFIIDRHPAAENVWLIAGGSGHGFKHGPAVGEMVSELVMEDKSAPAIFGLKRLE